MLNFGTCHSYSVYILSRLSTPLYPVDRYLKSRFPGPSGINIIDTRSFVRSLLIFIDLVRLVQEVGVT